MITPRVRLAVFALIIAAGMGYFFILPQWAAVRSLGAQIRELQALREELRELILIRDKLAADYEKIPQSDIAKLQAMVPQGPQPAGLVVDLEALAQRSGVALTQVNVAAGQSQAALGPAPASGLTPIPVSFNIVASYETLQTFLSNLERNRRIIDITEFSFAPGAGGGVPVAFQARAYYRP